MFYPLTWTAFLSSQYRRLELIRSPLQSITSITITHGTGTTDTLTTDQYTLDTDTDPATLMLNGYTLLQQDRLCVNYVAGYGNNDSYVPAPLKQAILIIVGNLYAHRGDEDYSMSNVWKQLCNPYKITFFGAIETDGR